MGDTRETTDQPHSGHEHAEDGVLWGVYPSSQSKWKGGPQNFGKK